MDNDILDSLNDLGYTGPLTDEAVFAKAVDGGPKSLEYTKLIHILAEELKKLCNLEETVNMMNNPDESSSFLLELSSFLKELGCPYKKLVTGHMSSRLETKEDKILLLDYLISELMAARIVGVDRPKEKPGMEIVMQESPTAKDLKDILIALKFNKPPPNITAEMLFSKLESKLKDTIQKEVRQSHAPSTSASTGGSSKDRGGAAGSTPKQNRKVFPLQGNGADLVHPKAQSPNTSQGCPQTSSTGKQTGPDPFADWQEVDYRSKKQPTGKPHPARPAKPSSDPSLPVQRQGGVAKKKNKNQRRAARLLREQLSAEINTPASGHIQASSKPVKPAPTKQSASGKPPLKKKGSTLPPKDGALASTSAGTKAGLPQRLPGKNARAAAKRTWDESFSPQGTQASSKPVELAPTKQTASGKPLLKGKGSTLPPKDGALASTSIGTKAGLPQRLRAKRTRESFSSQEELKKRRLVNPCQPGVSYARAASDLMIVITDEKSGKITADQSNAILRGIHTALVEEARKNIPGAIPPRFKGKPIFAEGQLRVFAQDEYSAAWSQRCVKALSLPDISLKALRQSDMARRIRCGLFIPNIDNSSWENVRQAADGLKYQNEWAKVGTWAINQILRQDQGWFVTFTIPVDLVPTFMERGRAMNCGVGQVYLKFKGPGGKYIDQPPVQGANLKVTGAQVPTNDAGCPEQTSVPGESATSRPTVPELSEELFGTGEGLAGSTSEGEELLGWIETGLSLTQEEGMDIQDGPAPTNN